MTRNTQKVLDRIEAIGENPQDSTIGDNNSLSMGYATNLNKNTAREAFNSTDFLQDAAEYYFKRDGKTFSSAAEIQDYFMSDRRWRNMNTISIGKDLYDAHTSSDEQSARLARMQGLFDSLPSFYEEGGDGWKGLGENALAAVADPINLIGFGAGGAAAKTAAAAAIASGAKKAVARNAGLKAGVKTGAISEAAASGLVEGVADQGIQRRNVELGLQDEVSYLQTGAAMGIGAVTGGALGGVFGAAGAVNPLRKGGKSNIAEGMLEGANARRQAANMQRSSTSGTTAESTEPPVRFSQEEKAEVAEMVNKRVARLEKDRVDNSESPDTDPVDLDTNVPDNEARAASLATNRMLGLNEAAAADRAAAKVAYGNGDAKKGAELDTTAEQKQQKSNDIQKALETIISPEKTTTPEDIKLLTDATKGADRLLLGFDPEARTQGNLPDGSPVRDETYNEELDKKVNIPVKAERQNLTGRTEQDQIEAERVEVVEASVAVREAETEVTNLEAERKPVISRVEEAEEVNKAITARVEAGEAVDPQEVTTAKANLESAKNEVAELDTRVAAAKEKLAGAEEARRNVMTAQSPEIKQAAAEVEATPNGTPVAKADDIEAEEVIDNVEEYSPDNVADATPPTTTAIVELLEALGDNTPQVRKELKALGDGRKPEVKRKRREFLRNRLKTIYARHKMMGMMELIGAQDQSAVFHLDLVRAQILENADDDIQGKVMVQMYNDFVGNRAKDMFIAHLERTSADPLEAIEIIRGRYGDEMVSILNERLGRGTMNISLADAQAVRDRFKTLNLADQKNFEAFEEKIIADMLAKDPSFNENTVRAIVYEMTERKLRRDLDAGGRTTKRLDTVINQEVNSTSNAINELRDLRKRMLALKASVPARRKATMVQDENGKAINSDILERILKGEEPDIMAYNMTPSEPLTEAQQELVDVSRRGRELVERLGFRGQTMGEAIEKLSDRLSGLENMRGKDILVHAKNGTRGTQDYSVADEYANAALHIGAQRRQGLGTYTVYGKQRTGGDAIHRAQKMLQKANKFGLTIQLRNFGVKTDADGRLQRVGSAMTAMNEIFNAAIAAANNRMVKDPVKVERNRQELAPLEQMVKDIKKAENKIKRLEKKGEDVDAIAEAEAELEAINAEATKMVDGQYIQRAELPRQALQERIRELTQSTGTEAAANRKEVFMSEGEVNLIKTEISALKSRLSTIARRKSMGEDGSKMAANEEEQIMQAIQRLTKRMDNPTEKGTERTLNKTFKENLRAERAAERLLKGEELPETDFVGDMTPEVATKAHGIANEVQRGASVEMSFSRRFTEIAESPDLTPTEKIEALKELNANMAAHLAATKAPNTIPAGKKHKPHVVVVDGIEVDVHNDFTYTKQGDRTVIGFEGETLGTIEKLGDGILFTKAGDGSGLNARKYPDRASMRDAIPALFRDRIKAKQEETQKFDVRPDEEGMAYAEPDWTKTETYREEPAVPEARATDPIEEPRVLSDPNNPLTRTVDDFDLPPGKDIALQITDPESGKLMGSVRVFSRKNKQTVGDVLKNSAKFNYVVGHVDSGVKSNSFAAQETFRPFDGQDSFIPAYDDNPVTLEQFEPRLATQSAKVRRKRPQKLEKLLEMSVDPETLSFTRHDGKPINNARDLYEYSVTLDQIEWSRMRDMSEFQTFFELRQRVSAELNSRIPNGVRMPTHTMRQSMNNLTKIMDELSPSETQATVDFMLRLARTNGGAAPIFRRASDEVDPNISPNTSDFAPELRNTIGLSAEEGVGRFDEQSLPQTFKVAHELGHWVYFNMLDEADRIEFWGAMKKFYPDDGAISSDMLKKRADIFGSGKSNALSSPQEFFANQFVLWASNAQRVPNLSLWGKVARMGAKLLDMITGNNRMELDADLASLFQRKLPPLGVDPVTGVSNNGVSPFAHLADFGKKYGKDGGNKAYIFGKAMTDLDVMRSQLQTAIATSNYTATDATALAQTMQDVTRRVYGMIGGKTGTSHHPDYKQGKNVVDAEGNSRYVEQGNARLAVLDQMKSYNRLAKSQYAIHEFLNQLRAEGAGHETKDGIIGSLNLHEGAEERLESIMQKQYAELESGGSFDAQVAAMQALQERSPFRGIETTAVMHLHRLTQEMMLAMDDMIKDVSQAYQRQIPRSGKEFVTVDIKEGINKGRMYQSRNSKTRAYQKMYADAEAKRQEEFWNLSGFVKAVNAERILRVKGSADPQISESPKMSDTDALAKEGIGLTGGKRRVDIANELKDRMNTKPKTKAEIREDLSDAEKQIMDSMQDEEGARRALEAAMRMQDDPNASEMAARIIRIASEKLHDFGVENPISPTSNKVSNAVAKVVENKAGVDDDIGIDAGTPAATKIYARLLTHRDQRSAYIGRQVFQRMAVLLGDDVPMGEYNMNVMLARSPEQFGDDDLTPIPSDNEMFIGVIKRMRQIAKAAQENPEEANELVARSMYHMLPPSHRASVEEYAVLNDVSGEEFYASMVNNLLVKGKTTFDKEEVGAGWIKKSNALRRIFKEGSEQTAFVLNGLSDSDTQVMKMAYGDMFASARQATPVVNAADAVHRNAVSPTVAGKYASEIVRNMSGRVETAAREFLGISPAEPMSRYVMFNRAEDKSVSGVTTTEEGQYGTGIYLKKGADVEKTYDPETFSADMQAKITQAGLSGQNREAALDAVKMIMGVRERIKMAINGGGSKAFIRDLLHMEDLQYQILNEISPTFVDNKVSPVLVRADNTFDMSSNSKYTITGDDPNSIGHLVSDMAQAGLIDEEGVRRLINLLPDSFSGRAFHQAMTHPKIGVLHKMGNSSGPNDSMDKLNQFLTDYGYDSLVTDEGMVAFSENNVRHVKNGFTESEATGHLGEKHGGDIKMGGTVAMEMFYRNEPVGKGFAPGIAKELERSGTPEQTTQLALKILKGQNLEAEDVEKASVFSSVRNFFTENSRLFRTQGARWFGDLIKPLNGAGLFERHDVELNGIVAPIYQALNKLPGNRNGFSRWARKNVEFINAIGQPASHKRIIDALRMGRAQVERLDPQERTAALKIASAFESELEKLREMGMPVGDARRYGNDFYVPQVWDSEVILANPTKFREAMKNFLIREQRRPDYDGDIKDIGQIEGVTEGVFSRITGEGGILDGTDVLTKALSDPMATRMLRLRAEDYPELNEFLVNDLSGLLARYFDRTVRKRQLSAKFGLQGHGFDSYVAIIQRGPEAAAEILQSNQNLVIHRDSLKGKLSAENLIVPRLDVTREGALDLIRQVKSAIASDEVSGKQKARNILMNAAEISTRDFPQYRIRVDAIVNALADFPQGGASRRLVEQMNNMNNVLNKRPIDGSSGNELKHKFTRNLKAFNSVSLLGFTTLTSIPDIALPLIRSGNMRAFARAWSKYMADPQYRAAAKNIGVGIENLLHDRMVQMGGEGSQKFTNAFFNFTLLTPWTNMQREVAAMVGFEAFKTEINRAVSMRMNGKKNTRGYQKALRFLERYGLTGENAQHDFLAPGSYRIDDLPDNEVVSNQVKAAMLRFTNEAIFTPNPNDVPMWAQSPWGSLMFQLKSFPLMMSRLTTDVLSEASKGNIKPLAYLLTAGVGLGMVSVGVKDVVQSRGGEDQRSPAFRKRALSKIIPVEEGGDYDERLGWYAEGLMAMGGLGLFAELLYNASAQLDNGKYGYVRTMSYIFGPAVGTSEAIFDVAAGVGDAVMGDAEKNGKERQGARQVASRIPVLGGVTAFREGAADLFGEQQSGGKKKGFGQGGFGGSFGKGKFGS